MKIGAVFHFLSETDWLHLAVEAISPVAQDILIIAADVSWKAGDYAPSKHRDYLNKLQARTKSRIHIIGGRWSSQKEQRQGGLDACKKLGLDYAFTLDCDEIMDKDLAAAILHEAVTKGIGNISLPCYTYYKEPWYRVEPMERHGLSVLTRITPGTKNLGPQVVSGRGTDRVTSEQPHVFLTRPFHHFSWVRQREEQIIKKIKNHSCPISDKWYQEKWKRWNPNMTNFHPVNPPQYARVRRLNRSELLPQATQWAAENGRTIPQ